MQKRGDEGEGGMGTEKCAEKWGGAGSEEVMTAREKGWVVYGRSLTPSLVILAVVRSSGVSLYARRKGLLLYSLGVGEMGRRAPSIHR